MEWLSKAVPQIGDERGGFVHQIRGNDEAYKPDDDTVTLQSACRTADRPDYIKHMDVINKPFTQNIKDTLEKINDFLMYLTDTDDYYLLQAKRGSQVAKSSQPKEKRKRHIKGPWNKLKSNA